MGVQEAPRSKRGQNTAEVGERTRAQILDAAERLFAENGPSAVSIRAIASAAQVNLAAVNYHFVSKDRLFEEVFRRRVLPLNEERLTLLEQAVKAAGPGRLPTLEAVVEAFVRPPMRLAAEASSSARAIVVMQFLSRAFSMPGESGFLQTYYEPVRSRFITMLKQLLPELATEDVLYRYNFLVGAIIYAMGGPSRMIRLPNELAATGIVSPGGVEDAVRHLVAFAVAGLRAASVADSRAQGASRRPRAALRANVGRRTRR
jgi:AcrR family transcriptional regulator